MQTLSSPCLRWNNIDYHRGTTYQKEQEEAFEIQLCWAKRYRIPVVIHCRNAFEPTIRILERHQDGMLRGVFHCFGGNLQEAQRVIDLGFLLGIGGVVTFRNASLPQVVEQVDLVHLVLETDAPYLAPAPYRGKQNEPAYLFHIAQRVAIIKRVQLEEVATVTTSNAKKLFSGK